MSSLEILDLAAGPHLLISTVDISERKRAETALAAAAANTQAIIENTSDYIWSVDRSCCLLFANSAYQRHVQEQIGRTLAAGEYVVNEAFPPGARSFWEGIYERALVGEALSQEILSALQPGAIMELSLYPILAADGAVVGAAGRAVDMTKRRQLEQVLAASEERLRWAMDATSEGLWDWDILTGAVLGNDQWHRLFGYEPDEIPATINLWSSALHPDDAPAASQALDDYLQGRSPDYASEYRVVTRSGEVRWHRSVGKVVAWDANGRPGRMVGTNADITVRKLAELRLRHSEERFRFIVESAPIAIAIWGEDGAMRYVSSTVESNLGLSPAELVAAMSALQAHVADPATAEVTPELLEVAGIDEPAYARAGLRALETVRYCLEHPGEKVRIEETLPHAGSGAAVDMQYIYQSFAYNATGREVVTVAYDISEHRALERLLRETNVELERQVAARTAQLQETVAELRRANAGKDAFLAVVSHELRTPIMGVLSMGELLESEARGPLNANQARYVKTMVESGRRLQGTVNSILLYTQVMTGAVIIQKELCSLEEICALAASAIAPQAAHKQQQLTHAVEPPNAEIVSDAQSLLNILRVLLDNAVKFTPVGGSIELLATAAPGARYIYIVVADTGIGMSEEQVAGLFRPFVQGDLTLARRFDGLGLGLAYASKMAELLGGSLTVASAPDQGSRFTLALPCA